MITRTTLRLLPHLKPGILLPLHVVAVPCLACRRPCLVTVGQPAADQAICRKHSQFVLFERSVVVRMMRSLVLAAVLTLPACSGNTALESPTSPTVHPLVTLSSVATGVTCSNEAPVWLTTNRSVAHGLSTVLPYRSNATVLDVEISYSRDGSNITASGTAHVDATGEYRLVAGEGGGRYYVRLRSADCDGQGTWSSTLTVYFEDDGEDPDGNVFPEQPEYCPYAD